MLNKSTSALIIVGHGSTVNPDSSTPTLDHARELRRRRVFAEVHCAFWKEEPSLRDVLRMVDARDVYVVPNFISEGYFTQTVIPRELRLTGPVTEFDGKLVRYCEPAGNHPRMTEVLLHRAAEVALDVPPEQTSLIIIGHGTSLNENSAAAVNVQVARIRERSNYAQVIPAFMEESPLISEWPQLTDQPNVVAVPFFIADGLHSYQDIPVLMGMETETGDAASRRQVFRRNPYQLHGRQVFYASAIGTDPQFADVIVDQVDAFEHREQVARSGKIADALARWIGSGRRWMGEVVIEAAPGGGFSLRHRLDEETAGLTVHDSPEVAREIARDTSSGEYRPLKTAPDLRRGWLLRLRDSEELRVSLDQLYPAMAGNFLAHEQGRLQPVMLRETANRQTGMYERVKTITTKQADELIAQFCTSCGGCLKTILWEIDPGQPVTTLPPEKFDPAFDQTGLAQQVIPMLCPEPCNLLIAKARKVVRRKRE